MRSRNPRRHGPGDQEFDEPEVAPLDFIPIELVGRVVISTEPSPPDPPDAVPPPMLPQLADADESWTDRTSLFGEPEA